MKKLIFLTILFCSTAFGQIWKFDEWGGNLYTSTNAEIYGLNNVPLKHLLGGKYTFSRAGADLEALFDKIDSLTLAMSSLNIIDDGLTTQILIGGGLNVVPVWGTNLPTAVTIGSAYIYRVGGTDVADGDVADTITITNISQVQDIIATATEINYTTDVTSNIQAQIDSKQDTVLGISSAEIAFLDGLTDTIQQQLDLKAPLTAPTFATSITGSYLTASEILGTDASKNIVSLAVATYPNLTELTYVKGVTSAIQTQMDLKAPLASPTFTGVVTAPSFIGALNASDGSPDSVLFIGPTGTIIVRGKIDITNESYFAGNNQGYRFNNEADNKNLFVLADDGTADFYGNTGSVVIRFTNAGKVGIGAGNTSPDIALSNNGAYNYWADTSGTNGNVNALGINTNDFGTAELTDGIEITILCNSTNTGAVTLYVNAGTNVGVKKYVAGSQVNLAAGDIVGAVGFRLKVSYDATNNIFQTMSPLAQ